MRARKKACEPGSPCAAGNTVIKREHDQRSSCPTNMRQSPPDERRRPRMTRFLGTLTLFLCVHSPAWASVDDPFTDGKWLIGFVLGGSVLCSLALAYVLSLRHRR